MFKKIALAVVLLSSILAPSVQAEISVGDLSARLDELEKRSRGENSLGDELATKEDIENLATAVRLLTGRIEVLEHQKNLQEKSSVAVLEPAADPLNKTAVDYLDPPARRYAAEMPVMESGEDTDVDAVLESLGAPTLPAKAAAKEKIEEKREKATKKAEQAATSVLDTGSPAAQFDQAKALFNKEQFAEAEESFKNYLTTHPKGKEVKSARVLLGEAQLKQGKSDDAKSTFARAYQANSKGTEGARALLGLGESLAAKENGREKACVVLKKLKEDFPEDKSTNGLANQLIIKYHCS